MTITPETTPSVASPIRQISLPSVQIFSLNLSQVRTCLEQKVKQMGEKHPEVEEVWLFGSMARGDAVPGSDADLMVLLSQTTLRFIERSSVYPIGFCGIGTDVLVYTRAEMKQMQKTGNHFFQTVRSEGICLFQRENRAEQTLDRISDD